MYGNDRKENLPIHIILGASEYALIKTQTLQGLVKWGDLLLRRRDWDG